MALLRRVASQTFCRELFSPAPGFRSMCLIPPQHVISPKYEIDYSDLSSIALKLYTAGIEEVSADAMIGSALKFNSVEKTLELYSKDFVLHTKAHSHYHIDRNVHVVAVGKAVTGMCRSVEDMFSSEIVQALAVIPDGAIEELLDADKRHLLPSSDFEMLITGDGPNFIEDCLASTMRVAELAKSLTSDDILIALISGGGSSLLALPKYPLTIEDKMNVVQLMVARGVSPLEQNTVRKNLSQIKGGGLSAMASPAKVISLILSDLPHNQAVNVAGGITTADTSTPQQALEILRKHKLVQKVPRIVIELLEHEAQESTSRQSISDGLLFNGIHSGPKPRHDTSNTVNILTGSDDIAAGAIISQCIKYEIPAKAITQSVSPLESGKMAHLFACVAQYIASILTRKCRSYDDGKLVSIELECIKMGMTKVELKHIAKAAEDAANLKKPICLIFKSQILVRVEDTDRKGGPCQELALATAIELKRSADKHDCLQKCDVQLFSIDSDGIDGNSAVAGAIANCHQGDKIVCGQHAEEYLQKHESYSFYANLEEGKYHVVTGATGTDIQNFQLLLMQNKSSRN